MSADGAGVQHKLDRARSHLDELNRFAQTYLEGEPFWVEEVLDPQTGDKDHVCRVRSHPPAQLSLIVGDVVHNLWSALDHLAWQLVIANGGAPSRKIQFPAGRSASEFRKEVSYRLGAASSAARAEVLKSAVHPTGNRDLWAVRELDIEDKHKLIITAGMAYRSFNMHTSFRGFPGQEPLAEPTEFTLPIQPADRLYPLMDGDVLLKVAKAAQDGQPEESGFSTTYSFTTQLVFGPDTFVAGSEVLPTVPVLVQAVEAEVGRLRPLLA